MTGEVQKLEPGVTRHEYTYMKYDKFIKEYELAYENVMNRKVQEPIYLNTHLQAAMEAS